ncbi:hypothetical protein B0H19DRAFT_939702 [Mycena capillaripes]|nr:hypothetical protein B0H19DRAFT_939702 [Mycena capillaripes]
MAKKTKAGHNGIGYRHVHTITIDSHPPYKARTSIPANAKAQWVLTNLVSMAKCLEQQVAGDGNKYRLPIIRSLTEYLNDFGGLKKADGVKTKLADVRYLLSLIPHLHSAGYDHLRGCLVPQNSLWGYLAEVWDALILSRPECTPFRSQGWPPYEFFECLDPAKPKGDHSFRPRIGVTGNDVVASADSSEFRMVQP